MNTEKLKATNTMKKNTKHLHVLHPFSSFIIVYHFTVTMYQFITVLISFYIVYCLYEFHLCTC